MGKTFKTIGWIVMTGVVLLFGTEWWLEGKIGRRAGEKLYEATGGRIKADIGNVNVSLLQRKVQFEEVVFTTDTSKALIAGNPLEYAEARIRKLTVKGIHYDSKDSLLTRGHGHLNSMCPKQSWPATRLQTGNLRKKRTVQPSRPSGWPSGNLSCGQARYLMTDFKELLFYGLRAAV